MKSKHIINCPNCGMSIDAEPLFRISIHWVEKDWCGILKVICHNCGKLFEIERLSETVANTKYQLAGQEAARKRVKEKRNARKKEKRAKERIQGLEDLRTLVLKDDNLINDDLYNFAVGIGEPQ